MPVDAWGEKKAGTNETHLQAPRELCPGEGKHTVMTCLHCTYSYVLD